MARYRLEGSIVDTKNAAAYWDEATRWNGNNHISVNTKSQWEHQTLYKSRKGRYYVEHTSQRQGTSPIAEWVSPQEAARWLLLNECENIPEDLWLHIDDVSE